MNDELDRVLASVVRGDAPALYLLLDDADRVVESNVHTQVLFGRPLQGVVFSTLLATFERELNATVLARSFASRNINVMAFTGLPQTYRASFLPIAAGTVVFGSIDPVDQETLRRELLTLNQELSTRERALQQSLAELARLGRLKDQFLGMAAHDLRSPLTAIAANALFLQEALGPTLQEESADSLRGICEAADLMRDLIESFLDTALIEAGQLRLDLASVDLGDAVARAVAMVEPLVRRRSMRVQLELGPGLPRAMVDKSKLQQVIINLVNNAVQHSPDGAEVLVAVRHEGPDVVLEVSDRGAGISVELMKGLYAAYVHGDAKRTHAERSIGLGLAITRMIVLAHGGQVNAVSAPGEGSTFTVRLPLR